MKFATKEEASSANVYYAVIDRFGSIKTERFSTVKEARDNGRNTNVQDDLVIVKVDMVEKTETEVLD